MHRPHRWLAWLTHSVFRGVEFSARACSASLVTAAGCSGCSQGTVTVDVGRTVATAGSWSTGSPSIGCFNICCKAANGNRACCWCKCCRVKQERTHAVPPQAASIAEPDLTEAHTPCILLSTSQHEWQHRKRLLFFFRQRSLQPQLMRGVSSANRRCTPVTVGRVRASSSKFYSSSPPSLAPHCTPS